MKLPVYSRNDLYANYGSYHPNFVTKLCNNYRSHHTLLKLPSELFYNNELKACSPLANINPFESWDMLRNKKMPIMFYGIEGKDEREGNSPSWFNTHEIHQVKKYIDDLLNAKQKVTPQQIGVIAPYQKQVEKLKQLFDKHNLKEIKVGSVEQFQGQERRVIIITTVRSQKGNIPFDLENNLGFLKNPKRFNVAITRPQQLLLVVGNPHVLVHDFHWRELLKYCKQNNACGGCSLPNLDDEKADAELLAETFSRLSFQNIDANQDRINAEFGAGSKVVEQ